MKLKKILALILAILSLLPFQNAVFAKRYPFFVHVAVLCDRMDIAEKYIRQMCERKMDTNGFGHNFLDERGDPENRKTVVFNIREFYEWHITFHPIEIPRDLRNIQGSPKGNELNRLLKFCSSALIMYDLADPKIDEALAQFNYKKFMHSNLMIPNCIRALMESPVDWYRCIIYAPYNTDHFNGGKADDRPQNNDELMKSELFQRTEKIKHLLGSAEQGRDPYDSQNRWGRAHLRFEDVANTLVTIQQEARENLHIGNLRELNFQEKNFPDEFWQKMLGQNEPLNNELQINDVAPLDVTLQNEKKITTNRHSGGNSPRTSDADRLRSFSWNTGTSGSGIGKDSERNSNGPIRGGGSGSITVEEEGNAKNVLLVLAGALGITALIAGGIKLCRWVKAKLV